MKKHKEPRIGSQLLAQRISGFLRLKLFLLISRNKNLTIFNPEIPGKKSKDCHLFYKDKDAVTIANRTMRLIINKK